MGLDELKAKYQEEKDERKKKKISEMMLGESRVMCRLDMTNTQTGNISKFNQKDCWCLS